MSDSRIVEEGWGIVSVRSPVLDGFARAVSYAQAQTR